MKIMIVDPAADWSTRDVYNGLRDGLRAHGHEIIEFRSGRLLAVFAYALERAWRQNGRQGPRPTPADSAYLVAERVVTWALRHEPDWTIVVSGMYHHPDGLVLSRRAGLRTALLLTESPYDFVKEAVVAPLADLVWTNERTAVAPFRALGADARYLPHAWNPATHRPDGETDPAAPAHDVLFVGTGFRERIALLHAAAAEFGADRLALYGTWIVGSRNLLRASMKGDIIANAAAAQLYRKAAVNLNLFRTSVGFGPKAPQILGAESLGPRAYELAALGAFFVSERRPEVEEVFGDLVPTFGDATELVELVRRWLPDRPGREAIRRALPAAVRGHSWIERAAQVVADLRSAGGAGPRSAGTARDASAAVSTGEPLGMGALETSV